MTRRNHPLIFIRQGHNHDHVTKLINAKIITDYQFPIAILQYRGGGSPDFVLSEVKFPKEQKWVALTNGVSRPGTAAADSSTWPPPNLWGLASRGASVEVAVKPSGLWLKVEEDVLSALGGEVYLKPDIYLQVFLFCFAKVNFLPGRNWRSRSWQS